MQEEPLRYPTLWKAAYGGRTEMVRQLLADGADVEEPGGSTVCTPVTIAAARGHQESVRVLLQHGALMSIMDKIGRRPLHAAASEGQLAIVRPLTLNHKPRTQNPQPQTPNPTPKKLNPKPDTPNPQPPKQNPEPQTPNPNL